MFVLEHRRADCAVLPMLEIGRPSRAMTDRPFLSEEPFHRNLVLRTKPDVHVSRISQFRLSLQYILTVPADCGQSCHSVALQTSGHDRCCRSKMKGIPHNPDLTAASFKFCWEAGQAGSQLHGQFHEQFGGMFVAQKNSLINDRH